MRQVTDFYAFFEIDLFPDQQKANSHVRSTTGYESENTGAKLKSQKLKANEIAIEVVVPLSKNILLLREVSKEGD